MTHPGGRTVSNVWTRYTRTVPGARNRLLCFPCAGGGAGAYRSWVEQLAASGTEVWPLQLPGRENRLREAPIDDLGLLVGELADEFADRLGELPFALFGHSVGARVAFEFTRELRRRGGAAPVLLIVAANRPPHRPDPDPPAHTLPHDRFIARLRTYGGTPEAVFAEPSLMDLLFPVMRADFALAERGPWVHEPPLSCPITVFGGLADKSVRADELQPWAELTTGAFTCRMFDGGHFFLTETPHLVVAAVREALRQVMEGRIRVDETWAAD
jgi:medium-chain acyl-[acyl-carrier-protein] hydrolase